MGGDIVGRSRELQAMQAVLQQARHTPIALILDGEAGIGKTTLWRAAADWANGTGSLVLTATGAAAEVPLAWAALTEVLAGMDEARLTDLSALHRYTLEVVITGVGALDGDERLVATAFKAALDVLSRQQPVLLAIDDAQWIDEASKMALGFAVRRLTGAIGILATYRSSDRGSRDQSWLTPRDPEAVTRLTLGPMSLGALSAVIAARGGPNLSRPTMVRMHSLSGGNPFYALELARNLREHPGSDLSVLPPMLARLVNERIGDLDALTTRAAVTAAAAVEPTVDVVSAAIGRSPAELVKILQPLEERGVLIFDGHSIRFTHPLIPVGITAGADGAAQRRAHRRLADVLDQPELRARHLALSTPHGDPDTLACLDSAADTAFTQGAPAIAAELVDLAMKIGGDTPARRILSAGYHVKAGELSAARAVIEPAAANQQGLLRAIAVGISAATHMYDNNFAEAAALLVSALDEAGPLPAVRAPCLSALAIAEGMCGQFEAALKHAADAVTSARDHGLTGWESQALAVWVMLKCHQGQGFDVTSLDRAIESEQPDSEAPVIFSARAVRALIASWTGDLISAQELMGQVHQHYARRGALSELLWVDFHRTFIALCLGRYQDAQNTADDVLERSQQLDGQNVLVIAALLQAVVAAHCGREDDTRRWARRALDDAPKRGALYLTDWPLMSLGVLDVSLGNHAQALNSLQPLLDRFALTPGTEIVTSSYLPDAVEALVMTGRLDEAEPLVAALETNGARLDRPWMLAVGARCRALLAAAAGDLDDAYRHAERAMVHHDRLPMPFERARTQLLVGQLLRRRRRPQAARTALSQAAAVFDEIGSTLWAARAQRELDRLTTRSVGGALTDAEREVAEKAAAGLSNKQIASTSYLSPKTVEMYLSHAYRKLGIRSRAQLADRLRQLNLADRGH